MSQDKTLQNYYWLAVFELVFSLVPQNIQNTMCFVDFIKQNRLFHTNVLYDVATAKMLQNSRVLRMIVIVKVKNNTRFKTTSSS